MYLGICKEQGTVVRAEDAFRYALERVSMGTPEEKQEFIDWYYSGNWIEEDEHESVAME